MPRNFYILRDDRGWWAVSNAPFLSEQGSSHPSYSEAFDHLRNLISTEGLIMGRSYPEGTGVRVEAFEPGEPGAQARPMLYSAEALNTIEEIREQLGRLLKERALNLARRGGRHLVTGDDVWAALEGISIPDIDSDSSEGVGDER